MMQRAVIQSTSHSARAFQFQSRGERKMGDHHHETSSEDLGPWSSRRTGDWLARDVSPRLS